MNANHLWSSQGRKLKMENCQKTRENGHSERRSSCIHGSHKAKFNLHFCSTISKNNDQVSGRGVGAYPNAVGKGMKYENRERRKSHFFGGTVHTNSRAACL